ncbi:MAG TPA: ROK family protein [Candidatus Paceibacterota bacterium]|nr:ROK family protein [Candidatus Paceibacterota bacterium]
MGIAREVVGIEIGGTKLQIVIGTDRGRILDRFRFDVDPGQGAAAIRRQIEITIGHLRSPKAQSAIGVGFGGPVDWRTGRICCSHHVEGWSGFPFGAWLREQSGLPVVVDNDANVAALAESHLGAGQGANPVFYVTLGSGVGGGLVVDGRVYHGATPGEAEIGHVRLDQSGATVESRCAGWAVDRKVRAVKAAQPHGLLARLVGQATCGEAKYLKAAIEQGDAPANTILRETASDLAFALSHVIHLFHPEVIVLGGGLSLIGEPLRKAVLAALPPCVMAAFQPGPDVRLAQLSEDAVPIGALVLGSAMPELPPPATP